MEQELKDKILDSFMDEGILEDEIREYIEYTSLNDKQFVIILREPLENYGVDYSIYNVTDDCFCDASGGYDDDEYAIECAKESADFE